MKQATRRNVTPKKTDWDRLNDLIDWYEANNAVGGREIQVRFSVQFLEKQIGKPNPDGSWTYRHRRLKRVEETI